MVTHAARITDALNVIETYIETWGPVLSHDESFTCYITDRILWEYALSSTEVEETITDRTGDRGTDAWFIPKQPEGETTITLIQAKDTKAEEIDVDKLIYWFQDLFDPAKPNNRTSANFTVQDKASQLDDLLEDSDFL